MKRFSFKVVTVIIFFTAIKGLLKMCLPVGATQPRSQSCKQGAGLQNENGAGEREESFLKGHPGGWHFTIHDSTGALFCAFWIILFTT